MNHDDTLTLNISISIFNVNLATQLKAATKNFYFLLILAPVDKWV